MRLMSSDMSISVFPADHPSLWSLGIKNLGTWNVSSCSFKGEILSSCDTLWKFRPKFNSLVPKHRRQHRKVIVMDSYTRVHANGSPAHWLHSRMEDACFPPQPFMPPSEKDHDKTLNCTKNDDLVSKETQCHPLVKSLFFTKDTEKEDFRGSDFDFAIREREQPLEEPWLLNSSTLTTKSSDKSLTNVEDCSESDDITPQLLDIESLDTKLSSESLFKFGPYSESDIFRCFSVRNQPVEEPWLVETSLHDRFGEEDEHNLEMTNQELTIQLHKGTDNLEPEEESSEIIQNESVPKVILINSSVCTMQRIAVLEDGKLVELLLEPVKNNVLCDSVYLGVVTKLVPHMGGAFVNIGTSRPSLMDIKNNREPFVFPPFRHSKEKEVNDSVSESGNILQVVDMTDEVEDDEVDDDGDQYSHNEYNEHDLEDDDVDIEALKGHVNGSVSGHSEVEVEDKWGKVRKGTKVVVQVVKEGLGTKGPTLTAYPKLRSRFWVLSTRCSTIGISKKISGVERTRLRVIAKTLQPEGFGLTARTVAAGHSLDELRKDLDKLILTWKDIVENAKSAALAADEGVVGALPVILHRAMGQTLSVVQDYFNEKVNSMVVDSPRTYHEVTNYLQQIAPDLCDRVELYNKRPLFDEYNIEEEISNMLSKRVSLANGGYLVIEQTEALVSIDVNGGQCMLGQGTSQENAILDVNLAAAKQIAREIRLRDIGGIIVVDFIDMIDDANKRLVYEEVKKSVERDRSTVRVSELSKNGLMEITRKRVRPSVTFMISEPCTCCHGTGRVEALETSFSKIEHEICRLLAVMDKKADPEDPKSWPKFILRVDRFMCNYLTSGKRTRLAILSSSLKVWILLKVARGFTRGAFEVKPLTSDKDNNSRKQVTINMLRPNTPRNVTVFPVKKWKSGRK